MKFLVTLCLLLQSYSTVHALMISEIMSNPTGDDSGREWIEVYNETENSIDISSLTVSIKGGAFVAIASVAGGTSVPAHGYAIVGSTVSGTTRFMQDYLSYSGPLFRGAISLVNTGVTSLEIKVQGSVVDTLASYTAAKEGNTYSRIGGSFVQGIPSPGEDNRVLTTEEETVTITTETTGTQATLPQASPPSADITLYLPQEKTVVAGAPSTFSVFSTTKSGKSIDNMLYTWAFGDGGQSAGSSTIYRYLYAGRYIAQVEGTNGVIAGVGRTAVRVVSPDISISSVHVGKYGPYIDITNPNVYDLEVSQWKLSVNGVPFSFPKNTILIQGVTRFPGSALGFASTSVPSGSTIKLLFPNMDEVLRITQEGVLVATSSPESMLATTSRALSTTYSRNSIIKKSSSSTTSLQVKIQSTQVSAPQTLKNTKKDVRVATFIKGLFGKHP